MYLVLTYILLIQFNSKSGRLFIPSDITRRNQQYASGVAPSLYPPYPPTLSSGVVYPPVVLPQQFSDHHPILNRGVGTTSHTGTVGVSPPTHSPLHASGLSSRSTPLVRNSFVTPGGSEGTNNVNTNASYPVTSYPTSSLSSLSAPASNNYQSSLPLRSPDSYVSSYLPPPLLRTRNTMQPTLTQLTGAGNGTTTDSNVTGCQKYTPTSTLKFTLTTLCCSSPSLCLFVCSVAPFSVSFPFLFPLYISTYTYIQSFSTLPLHSPRSQHSSALFRFSF